MKILLAGEGGQGIQTMAEILALAAFKEGKSALYIPNFGVEQRGGVSLAFLVIENKPVVYPKFEKADLAAILSERSWSRIQNYLDRSTKIIKGPGMPKGIKTKLPAKVWNMVVLGKMNQKEKIVSLSSLYWALAERFSRQFQENPQLKQLNQLALKE